MMSSKSEKSYKKQVADQFRHLQENAPAIKKARQLAQPAIDAQRLADTLNTIPNVEQIRETLESAAPAQQLMDQINNPKNIAAIDAVRRMHEQLAPYQEMLHTPLLGDEFIPPRPSAIPLTIPRPFSTAGELCAYFEEIFEEFEASIDSSEDIAVALSNFGTQITLRVSRISARGPSMLVMYGDVNGKPVVLSQHISQLSLMLMPVARKNPEEPRRRIGFSTE